MQGIEKYFRLDQLKDDLEDGLIENHQLFFACLMESPMDYGGFWRPLIAFHGPRAC